MFCHLGLGVSTKGVTATRHVLLSLTHPLLPPRRFYCFARQNKMTQQSLMMGVETKLERSQWLVERLRKEEAKERNKSQVGMQVCFNTAVKPS